MSLMKSTSETEVNLHLTVAQAETSLKSGHSKKICVKGHGQISEERKESFDEEG